MKKQFFGTDGIRGKVGEYPITPDFMLKLGWAIGRVLSANNQGKVLIGKDTRLSGYMLESALESGLSSAGLQVALLGPMPTPAIAYLTRTFRANAGIVVSASHNPFTDNGIKLFNSQGTKISDEIECAIEYMSQQPLKPTQTCKLGKAYRITDAAGRYIEFCKSTFEYPLTLDGLKIVLDCAHGATYQVASAVFSELGANVITIGASPDGMNINHGVGATAPAQLKSKVLQEKAALGIAFDGDGDRVIMVDHTGHIVDGDQLLYIIANQAHRENCLNGGIVGTQMSNMALESAFKQLGVPFVRSRVGDRYVLETLFEKGWIWGGENSGHIICLNKTTTGDGIIAALQVLRALVLNDSTLFELRKNLVLYPQVMKNVPITKKIDPLMSPGVQAIVADIEKKLGDKGRVLLRKSGTEPVVRVMVEGEDKKKIEQYVQEIAQNVQ